MESVRYIGTTKKTWLDPAARRVGRRYAPKLESQLTAIHNLCRDLYRRGIPVQQPLGPITRDDDGHLIAYYTYVEDDGPSEYKDGWYSPKMTRQRLRSAAAVFAAFQRAALDLQGPEKPLDFPLCNTLNWLAVPDPVETLLGPWSNQETTELKQLVTEFKALVAYLLPKARPIAERSSWGLCHGDFHSGNTIFQGDRLVQIVDFGFWVQHPLVFDLAIALEFWSQDWHSDLFRLDPQSARAFLQAYIEARGPLTVPPNLLALSAVSRLWIETHTIRQCAYPDAHARVALHMQRIVLPRLRWYAEHLEHSPLL